MLRRIWIEPQTRVEVHWTTNGLFPALGVRARGLAGRALLPTGPQDQLQRVAEEAEAVADLLLEVPPVGEVEQARVVDEENDRWSLTAGLGRVAQLEPPALEARWRMREEGLAQHA